MTPWNLSTWGKKWCRIWKTCFRYTFPVENHDFQEEIDLNRSILPLVWFKLDGFGFLVKFWPRKSFQLTPICQIPDTVRLNVGKFDTALILPVWTKSYTSANSHPNVEFTPSRSKSMYENANTSQLSCFTFWYLSLFADVLPATSWMDRRFSNNQNSPTFLQPFTLQCLFEPKFCALQYENDFRCRLSISP